MVSQEFPLVGQLSVAENLLLGQRPGTRRVRVDWRAMDDAARSMLKRVGLEVPLAPSRRLTFSRSAPADRDRKGARPRIREF